MLLHIIKQARLKLILFIRSLYAQLFYAFIIVDTIVFHSLQNVTIVLQLSSPLLLLSSPIFSISFHILVIS